MDLTTVLKLGLIALFPVVATAILYLLKRRTAFGNLPDLTKQIISGFVFGGVAILATEFGVTVFDGEMTAIINTRDAAAISAGLLFGGPAGIIAGIIGGAERALAVLWGAGSYTVVACSVSTALAGIISALLHRFLYDGRRPSALFAFLTAVVAEALHMTMVLVTHINDFDTAMKVVDACTLPMIVTNSLSVLAASLTVTLISREIHTERQNVPFLLHTVENSLLISVTAAFLITTSFVYLLQTNSAEYNALTLIQLNVSDVCDNITETSESGDVSEVINRSASNRHIGENGFIMAYDRDFKPMSYGTSGWGLDEATLISTFISGEEEDSLIICTVDGTDYYCCYKTISGYYVAGIYPYEESIETRDRVLYINSFLEILVFAVLFVVILTVVKSRVVDKVSAVGEKLTLITGGRLDEQVSVGGSREFASLSDGINKTVGALRQYTADAEKKMEDELLYAQKIQHSALPSVFPAFPGVREFDIFASMDTAKEVGGDFYDFYMPDNNHLAFLIADVSGKGIPAAMFMMKAKTLLRSLTEAGKPLGEVMTQGNAKLCENNDAEMFVTAWMAVLDIKTGHMDYVNAGHNPPLLYRHGVGFDFLRSRPGLVLAGMEGYNYKVNSVDLSPGDRILLYTDGVTEAENIQNELFGEERLKAYLNSCQGLKPVERIRGVKAAVDAFAGEREQFDDITMLTLDYEGTGMVTETKVFNAKTEELDNALAFMTGILEANDAGMKPVMQLSVAFEEMFVNVAHYAYKNTEGTVEVTVSVCDGMAEITLKDSGTPFNPLSLEDPDITLAAEDRKIGGLGIFMVRKTMDDVSYRYENNFNIFTMKKKI